MTTFEIKQEYQALTELLENEFDPETGEFVDVESILKEEIEKLNDEKESKLENIEYLKRDFKAKSVSLKDEIKRLQARAKSFERQVENLTKLQIFLLNGEKLKTDKFTFSFRKSKAVEIENEDIIPDDFKVISYRVDKTKLKKVLENEVIPGAKIVEKKSLSVR